MGKWWIFLYYPTIFLIMIVGNYLDKRKVSERTSDKVLLFIVGGMIALPLVVQGVWTALEALR